jgi:hypothetical protein
MPPFERVSTIFSLRRRSASYCRPRSMVSSRSWPAMLGLTVFSPDAMRRR